MCGILCCCYRAGGCHLGHSLFLQLFWGSIAWPFERYRFNLFLDHLCIFERVWKTCSGSRWSRSCKIACFKCKQGSKSNGCLFRQNRAFQHKHGWHNRKHIGSEGIHCSPPRLILHKEPDPSMHLPNCSTLLFAASSNNSTLKMGK